MDWRAFLILSKTRDYERMQFDRRREDYKRTKEQILKYSLQNQVKYHRKYRFSSYSPIYWTCVYQIFQHILHII